MGWVHVSPWGYLLARACASGSVGVVQVGCCVDLIGCVYVTRGLVVRLARDAVLAIAFLWWFSRNLGVFDYFLCVSK